MPGERSELDRHHLIPQSRCRPGTDRHRNNTVKWYRVFHERYHALFGNMTLPEVKEFLDTISQPHDTWDKRRLNRLRESIKKSSTVDDRRLEEEKCRK